MGIMLLTPGLNGPIWWPSSIYLLGFCGELALRRQVSSYQHGRLRLGALFLLALRIVRGNTDWECGE